MPWQSHNAPGLWLGPPCSLQQRFEWEPVAPECIVCFNIFEHLLNMFELGNVENEMWKIDENCGNVSFTLRMTDASCCHSSEPPAARHGLVRPTACTTIRTGRHMALPVVSTHHSEIFCRFHGHYWSFHIHSACFHKQIPVLLSPASWEPLYSQMSEVWEPSGFELSRQISLKTK